MAISGVNPKCYILALFVRDDGTRFLLGDDPFEFKDNQLHFQQNTMANDVVEVQGNDGYLLAGQVRRPGTQVFDGYVCNGTNSKEEVEVKRRAFLQFFRRSHFYKVIYVFPNGTAIQRKQGFLVDDPTVQELYQQYPEYHVALNFEDVNYYTYEEDDQGHEIYAKQAIVPLARGGATGGLIWDNYGVVWEDAWSLPLSTSGVQFQILNNAGARAPIDNVELYGDTYQQSYNGANLFDVSTFVMGGMTNGHITTSSYRITNITMPLKVYPNTTYTISVNLGGDIMGFRIGIHQLDTNKGFIADSNWQQLVPNPYTFTTGPNTAFIGIVCSCSVISTTVTTGTTESGYNASNATQWLRGCTLDIIGDYISPSPKAPELVQTVTGEQTVEVHGKNLLGLDNFSGTFSSNQYTEFGNILDIRARYGIASTLDVSLNSFKYTKTSQYDSNQYWKFKGLQPNTNYTVSCNYSITTSSATNVSLFGAYRDVSGNILTQTFTTDGNGEKEFINQFFGAAQNDVIELTNLMVEQGSTATAYQPFQSQTYTVDLGSIELCKIGDYQDKIYKSSDDWYVHKATARVDVSSLGGWFASGSYAYKTRNGMSDILPASSDTATAVGLCNAFSASTTNLVYAGSVDYGFALPGAGGVGILIRNKNVASLADFTTYLSNNPVYGYFALATPTNTKITDATLVGQLEAIGAMKLFIGENNVLVSAQTPNLPGTLAFDYYTKFAAIGAEWEEGGTKGATIVNVDAIDNTYPVWELTGPATNPTLSVLTTNTALTYNGTITASQKLVIDMFNKTATLNGTSVIGNISGDFVYMAPGTNRLAYTAGNTDAPDSTIYWQEVVG